ncbi:hypothetical protein DNI29_02220 [Hymenobacter sediminis]|uniref:hypothetical protein n=1 Tax=Hymenobacter sediminis TaxID=2218621 RepID=UPI000DA67FF7|nr:hypothetical protein [Hymenobacter sediminis]RPD49637.1 hypothetical protein DNI29_02220 [Hymenobacter sediminis]
MKKLMRGTLLGAGLCLPMLAYAGEQEEKYVFLLVGGLGGVLVGAGLYGILMVLAAMFVRRRGVVLTAFGLCVAFLAYMQFTSFRILRVAVGLGQRLGLAPVAFPLDVVLVVGLLLMVVFGLVVFRLALRMWKRRHAQRRRQAEG